MIVGTCWYLAGLLLLASFGTSAISVFPGREASVHALIATFIGGSLLSAATAIFLHTRRWHWIRESRLAKGLFLGFAALATALCLPFLFG